MAGRVDIASKRVKKGEVMSAEHAGLAHPEPFVAALFSFTARHDKEVARVEKEAKHKDAGPAPELARKIKAYGLFPSIYGKPHAIGPDA